MVLSVSLLQLRPLPVFVLSIQYIAQSTVSRWNAWWCCYSSRCSFTERSVSCWKHCLHCAKIRNINYVFMNNKYDTNLEGPNHCIKRHAVRQIIRPWCQLIRIRDLRRITIVTTSLNNISTDDNDGSRHVRYIQACNWTHSCGSTRYVFVHFKIIVNE